MSDITINGSYYGLDILLGGVIMSPTRLTLSLNAIKSNKQLKYIDSYIV